MSGFAAELGVLSTDVGEAVEDCAVEVIVTRFERGPRIQGRSGKPSSTTFKAMMSVQPFSQDERQQLPEGTRTEGKVVAFSTVELETVETSECERADEFCHENVNYVVEKVDNWDEIGGYFRIEASRLGQ